MCFAAIAPHHWRNLRLASERWMTTLCLSLVPQPPPTKMLPPTGLSGLDIWCSLTSHLRNLLRRVVLDCRRIRIHGLERWNLLLKRSNGRRHSSVARPVTARSTQWARRVTLSRITTSRRKTTILAVILTAALRMMAFLNTNALCLITKRSLTMVLRQLMHQQQLCDESSK